MTSLLETDHISMWRWDEAPPYLTKGMDHGGDEEWVFFIPARLTDAFEQWYQITPLQRGEERGYHPTLLHYRCKKVKGGWVVSTAHA